SLPADPGDTPGARVTTAGSAPPATEPENSSVPSIRRCIARQPAEIARPVKAGAGVGLATRRDVFVPGNTFVGNQRVGVLQRPGERDEAVILRLGERLVVGTLKLDADGEIVAVVTPLEQ